MIRNIKKILFLCLALLQTSHHCDSAYIPWNSGTQTPNPIPNDGNIYYISGVGLISSGLNVNGHLIIGDPISPYTLGITFVMAPGTLRAAGGTIEIISNASLMIAGNGNLHVAFDGGSETGSGTVLVNGGSLLIGADSGTDPQGYSAAFGGSQIIAQKGVSPSLSTQAIIKIQNNSSIENGRYGTSTITLNDDSILSLQTGSTIYNGRYIYGNGNININNTSTVNILAGGTFLNSDQTDVTGSSGNINVANSGILNLSGGNMVNGVSAPTALIKNKGNITVNGGTFNINNNSVFNNYDNLTINSGNIAVGYHNYFFSSSDGGGSSITINGGYFGLGMYSAGNVNVITKTTVNGGIFDINMASGITPGSLTIWGGPITVTGSGAINFINGNITNSNSGSLNISGGTVSVFGPTPGLPGATFTNQVPLTISGGTFNVAGGIVNNTNPFNVTSGTLAMQSGTFNNSNTVNVSGGTLSQQGGNFNNSNTVNVSGGTLSQQAGNINNNNTVNISGGTVVMQGGTITNAQSSPASLGINNCNFDLKGGTLTKGTGTSSLLIYGSDFYNKSNIILNGVFTNNGTGPITIPNGKFFNVENATTLINTNQTNVNGYLHIVQGGTLTNNGTLTSNNLTVIDQGGIYTNGGTASGNILNFNNPINATLPYLTAMLPPTEQLTIPQNTDLSLEGPFINESSSTLDIYGDLYTYSFLQNGDGISAGTINIQNLGNLYVLGGKLSNDNANSLINVKSGGSLYNYYGTVDLTIGGIDSLNLQSGGKFHNARGNNPGAFTVQNGCEFIEYEEINLDSDLDLDYTWTITEKAVIKGHGNKITFRTGGEIAVVGANASLDLDDITLQDISGNQIRCTDPSTTLSVHNIEWIQDGDYTFTQGNMYIAGEWKIKSSNARFVYQAEQPSLIDSYGNMHFYTTTLEYNTGIPNLIMMMDEMSLIHLERSTLIATQPCILADGTIITTGNSKFQGDSFLNLAGLTRIHSDSATTQIGNVLLKYLA